MRIADQKKTQSIPKLVNSQPRPLFRAFFFPNTVFHPPGIVPFPKESAVCKSKVNSQQKKDKMFMKSAQHLEIKRPSMPGTLPRGVPTGPVQFPLTRTHRCTPLSNNSFVCASTRVNGSLPSSARKFEVGTRLRVIFL